MIVSDAVRDYLSQIRPGPDPGLIEMEERRARRPELGGAGDGVLSGLQPGST